MADVLRAIQAALGIDTGASRREGACCQAAYDSDGHAHGHPVGPECTCPQVDISRLADPPHSRFITVHDPDCPVRDDGGCE
jgi:hypothetical protein